MAQARVFASAAVLLALAACNGQVGSQIATTDGRALTDTDRAAILTTLRLSANAQGLVTNECGEPVTPQFLPAELAKLEATYLP